MFPGPLRRVGITAVFALASMLAVAGGCAPEIGDSCTTSVDCSVNGDRICDSASPSGYCTVRGCERGSCPEDEGVCVEFRFTPQRTTSTWCMATCEESDDCRTEEGYQCLTAADIVGNDGAPIARSLEGDGARFCAYPSR